MSEHQHTDHAHHEHKPSFIDRYWQVGLIAFGLTIISAFCFFHPAL